MLDGLFIISIIGSCVQAIKEACEPVVPIVKEEHPIPHRDAVSGKIIIENCKLYYEDIDKYGAVQSRKWVREGRYNLSPEELEKEKERIKAKYQRLYDR